MLPFISRRKAQEGKEWLCPIFGHEHDSCQAHQKAENTDSCTNYAVKYATARGHLTYIMPYIYMCVGVTESSKGLAANNIKNSSGLAMGEVQVDILRLCAARCGYPKLAWFSVNLASFSVESAYFSIEWVCISINYSVEISAPKKNI